MYLPDQRYAKGLARAFGGAVIFAYPLTMTMEMWWLGFYMDRFRLLLFLLANLALLVGVSHFAGFERTASWSDDVLDAFAAVAVGFVASVLVLSVLGIIQRGMSLNEIAGKALLQSIPAAIGAVLARKQLGAPESGEAGKRTQGGYLGEVFLMAVGALFLAFNVAPTEEMILIAYKITSIHALVLVAASVILLHAFVFAVGFAGQEEAPRGATFGTTLLHYSITGYGVAVLVSLYVLWTFGRTDGESLAYVAHMTAVLAFPAALGAALARLIV